MSPKVSCLVSAYYAQDYIEGRIENLLEQRDVDIEVLACCAKDSPEQAILKGFGEAIVLMETIGIPPLYATWNELIKVATGEYITNSNSDDRLYQHGLRLLASALDKNKSVSVVYANTDMVKEIDGPALNRHMWVQGSFFDLVHGCFIGPMPMWRKEMHDLYGYFDEEMTSAGDYEFWLRLGANGEQFLHVPQVVGAYMRRDDQLERREPLRSIVEAARSRSRYVDWKTLYV